MGIAIIALMSLFGTPLICGLVFGCQIRQERAAREAAERWRREHPRKRTGKRR